MSPPSPSSPRQPVDWAAVHARLERATQGGGRDDAERANEVLTRRARELARTRETPVEAAERLDVVTFTLGGQVLAIEAEYVLETTFPRNLTRLPGLPEFVRGLVNVRSRVVPAIDLRPLLQLPRSAATEDEKLLIVAFEGAEFGLLAEEVLGPRSPGRQLRREVPGLNEKYLRGLADDGTVVLSIPALYPDLVVADAPTE
jgi:purine-binding chemotaxis protein CheW